MLPTTRLVTAKSSLPASQNDGTDCMKKPIDHAWNGRYNIAAFRVAGHAD